MRMTKLPRIGAGMAAGVFLLCGVAGAQPRPAAPGSPRFPLRTEPRVSDTFQQKIRVTVVAHGIERPWSLLPLPDGDFLVSVRATGQVLAIRKGVLDPKPLTGLPAMHTTRTTGMLDMAMHPKFAENRLDLLHVPQAARRRQLHARARSRPLRRRRLLECAGTLCRQRGQDWRVAPRRSHLTG